MWRGVVVGGGVKGKKVERIDKKEGGGPSPPPSPRTGEGVGGGERDSPQRARGAHLSVSPAKAGVHVFVFGGVGVDSRVRGNDGVVVAGVYPLRHGRLITHFMDSRFCGNDGGGGCGNGVGWRGMDGFPLSRE